MPDLSRSSFTFSADIGSTGSQLPFVAKRKRSVDEDYESVPRKPAKRKRFTKARPEDVETMDLEQGLNLAIGKLDSRLQADYAAQRTKKFSSDLSLVELEERQIPEKAFLDTSEWRKPRTLENMPAFLDHYGSTSEGSRMLSLASVEGARPHTLVITAAALRAADITRVLRTSHTKKDVVAKLFAKHIKLKDAIEYVKKTRMGIGVGTPSRIIDLLDAEVLIPSGIERVVIDASHIDQKKRGVFDMRETQHPLMLLLNRPGLKDRYGSGSNAVQILMY